MLRVPLAQQLSQLVKQATGLNKPVLIAGVVAEATFGISVLRRTTLKLVVELTSY